MLLQEFNATSEFLVAYNYLFPFENSISIVEKQGDMFPQ